MRAAPELLSALNIGRGSAQPGGGGGGNHRSQISLPSHPECSKKVHKRAVSALIDLKNAKNQFFT